MVDCGRKRRLRLIFSVLKLGCGRVFWLWGLGNDFDRSTCHLDRPLGTTLLFPRLPLPFLQVGETVYTEERDRTVVFASIMRLKVDPNETIKVPKCGGWMERLLAL